MNPMSSFTFSQKIVAEKPSLVVVRLREGVEVTVQKQGETILDLNRAGNWILGIEIVGGFVPFSVAKAVSPLNPVRPAFPKAPEPGTVTYDSEADAAFIYLEYDPTFNGLTPQAQAELKTVSRDSPRFFASHFQLSPVNPCLYTGCTVENWSMLATTKNQLQDTNNDYVYDAAGNLILPGPTGGPYVFDAENHLISAGGMAYLYGGRGSGFVLTNPEVKIATVLPTRWQIRCVYAACL